MDKARVNERRRRENQKYGVTAMEMEEKLRQTDRE